MTGLPRWVLHLPTRLTSLDDAAELVERMRATLGHVAEIDFAAATLSEKDRLMVRHPVFCGLRLPGGARCALRTDHLGPCQVGSGVPTAPV
ncbi:MAG TPA: hypothetical protein VGD43_11390 [Micromonospora sp.]